MSFCVFLRNGDGHGTGYDHDCCGSTTAAITALAMVTIAAAMATIAEPMGVLDRPPPPTANFSNGGVLLSMLAVTFDCPFNPSRPQQFTI